jgi:hypothetical protein
MHAAVLSQHLVSVLAVGRGIFIWLLLRGLVHTIGWPATLAVFVVVAVTVTVLRQRRGS